MCLSCSFTVCPLDAAVAPQIRTWGEFGLEKGSEEEEMKEEEEKEKEGEGGGDGGGREGE